MLFLSYWYITHIKCTNLKCIAWWFFIWIHLCNHHPDEEIKHFHHSSFPHSVFPVSPVTIGIHYSDFKPSILPRKTFYLEFISAILPPPILDPVFWLPRGMELSCFSQLCPDLSVSQSTLGSKRPVSLPFNQTPLLLLTQRFPVDCDLLRDRGYTFLAFRHMGNVQSACQIKAYDLGYIGREKQRQHNKTGVIHECHTVPYSFQRK